MEEFWSSAPNIRKGLPSTMSCLDVGVGLKWGRDEGAMVGGFDCDDGVALMTMKMGEVGARKVHGEQWNLTAYTG